MALQNTLKALADPIRREILNMLKNGRLSSGDSRIGFPASLRFKGCGADQRYKRGKIHFL